MMQKKDDLMEKLEKIAPNVINKIQCPICTNPFDKMYHTPFIYCQNKHSICGECINDLIARYNQRKSQKNCPICRKMITPIPVKQQGGVKTIRFQKDQQVCQLGTLIDNVTKMFGQEKKKVELAQRRMQQQKNRVSRLQRQLHFKTYEINMLKTQNSRLKTSFQLFKLSKNQQKKQKTQINSMFQKLSLPQKLQIQKPSIKRVNSILQTDDQIQKYEQKNNETNEKIIQDNKQLFQIEYQDIESKQQLALMNKFIIHAHIKNLVQKDLSKLVFINLCFNRIGDRGLSIFCKQVNAPELKTLKVSNNGLRSVSRHIANFKNLEQLELGNFKNLINSDQNQNLFTNEDIETILQTQFAKMRFLSIELSKETIWDKQQFLIKLMQRLPQVTRIGISTQIFKMTKKKMGQIATKLNSLINSTRLHPKMSVSHQV